LVRSGFDGHANAAFVGFFRKAAAGVRKETTRISNPGVRKQKASNNLPTKIPKRRYFLRSRLVKSWVNRNIIGAAYEKHSKINVESPVKAVRKVHVFLERHGKGLLPVPG